MQSKNKKAGSGSPEKEQKYRRYLVQNNKMWPGQ